MKAITLLSLSLALSAISIHTDAQENRVRYDKKEFPLAIAPNSVVGTPFEQDKDEKEKDPSEYPADCAEVLAAGKAAGDGSYTVYMNNDESAPLEVLCDMTSNGGGYNLEPFTLAMLDQPNEMLYKFEINTNNNWRSGYWNNTNKVMTEEDRGLYRTLISVGRTDLIGYTFGVVAPMPRLNGAEIRREYILPNIDIRPLSEASIGVYAGVSSWNGDIDTSRFYMQPRIYRDYENNPNDVEKLNSHAVFSPWGNWPEDRGYMKYWGSMPVSATHTMFLAQCRRNTGTQCSADVYDFDVIYFPQLPKVGDLVRIKRF